MIEAFDARTAAKHLPNLFRSSHFRPDSIHTLTFDTPGPAVSTVKVITMNARRPATSLSLLPNTCLQKILGLLDLPSLCSAARVDSSLHQAAMELFPSSISVFGKQRQLESLVNAYLPSYGGQVDSISFEGAGGPIILLHQLPASITRLTSLILDSIYLQLQPGHGYQGLLGAATAPPLKQLRLNACTLLDGGQGLAAALALLPGLEHLALTNSTTSRTGRHVNISVQHDVLLQLVQLTCLILEEVRLTPYEDPTAELQHLTALTRLQDLRLACWGSRSIPASALAGAEHLTRLELRARDATWQLEPDALAGKTLLQHLELRYVRVPDGAAGVEQLLSQLQELQQLTCLILCDSLRSSGVSIYPAAAVYGALTASSKLQRLDVSRCTLPPWVWEHVFLPGRQLPQLRALRLADLRHRAVAPAGTLLASCCPALQSLDIRGLRYSRGMLTELQGLSSLDSQYLQPASGSREAMQDVTRLTDLQQLVLQEPQYPTEGLLLQLTQLRQLTRLGFRGRLDRAGSFEATFRCEVGHRLMMTMRAPGVLLHVSHRNGSFCIVHLSASHLDIVPVRDVDHAGAWSPMLWVYSATVIVVSHHPIRTEFV